MSKIKELTSEQISLAERVKINARKMRLAGIGLISVADTESNRLYKQISELGKPIGGRSTLFGQISRFSSGAFSLAMEESQKRFDELVEEGESAMNDGRLMLFWNPLEKKKAKSAKKGDSDKASGKAKKKSEVKAKAKAKAESKKKEDVAAEGKTDTSKLTAKKSRNKATSLETLPANLKEQFESARQAVAKNGLSDQLDVLDVRSLEKQVLDGDVKGRRPAQSNEQACAEFDARKAIKGMSAQDAAARYISLIGKVTVEEAPQEAPLAQAPDVVMEAIEPETVE